MDMEINYLTIFAGAISAMVFGAIWYGPIFGKTWSKLSGITEKDMEKISKAKLQKNYLMGFVSYAIMAWGLYYLGNLLEYETVKEWVSLGFWIGVVFVGFGSKPDYIWTQRSKKLWLLNATFAAVSMAIIGWVLMLV